MANRPVGNQPVGRGYGDFEPSAGSHRHKHPADVVPGGDSRDYADRRPGATLHPTKWQGHRPTPRLLNWQVDAL